MYTLPVYSQIEFEAELTDIWVNSNSKIISVTYNIVNAQDDQLFLVEFRYVETMEYNVIYPDKATISGDAGSYAVRGGRDKQFHWNFRRQSSNSKLGMGEFEVDITLISGTVSKKLNRMYGRQNKIRVKLDDPNLRSKKRRRLKRRLNRVNGRIENRRSRRGY
jgi:hypothetical protein